MIKDVKNKIKLFIPPIILLIFKKAKIIIKDFLPEYEYIPNGWISEKVNQKIKGWNENSILEVYKKNWPSFIHNVEKNRPFGLWPESNSTEFFDLVYHNTLLIFAYCITVSSQKKTSVRMLDWEVGLGIMASFAKSLLPNIAIDYHCKDVPVLANYGQILFPEAKFFCDESYIFNQFDFILASASLHYVEDWKRILDTFVECSNGYILLTETTHNSGKTFCLCSTTI